MPNLMGLGAGLSGFAEGFGNEFAKGQAEKHRANAEMAKTFLTLGLHDPSIMASPEFEKILTKGFGKEGAQSSIEMIHHAEAGRQASQSLPFAPAGTTLQDLLTGGGQQPAAQATPAAATAPAQAAAPAAAPRSNVDAFAANLPPGASAPFPGTKMTVKSTRTLEGEKEAAFGPLFDATLNHVAGYVPKKDREIVAYHAVLDTLRHAGRLEMVPNRVWKLLNVDEQDIRKQDRELAMAGPKAAAGEQARQGVREPYTKAREQRAEGRQVGREQRGEERTLRKEERAAERDALKPLSEKNVKWGRRLPDGSVDASIHPPPGFSPKRAASEGYSPVDPADRGILSSLGLKDTSTTAQDPEAAFRQKHGVLSAHPQ